MKTTGLIGLFGAAVLGASALLFAVQPMVGKMLLPAFGGTPGVWNACMLFFQAALLAGYAYAHASASRLGVRGQAVLHGLLTVAALAFLPIRLPVEGPATSDAGAGPGLWLFARLAASAGLPLALIAATSPLLQRWFSLTAGPGRPPRDPFALYAASCAGNLAALAAYPLLIEPLSTLAWQTRAWAVGFGASSALTLACAAAAWRGGGPAVEASDAPPVAAGEALRWVGLAALPSLWLLALTTHLTTDLAPMPLLWTIPLGVYLVTYILAFAGVGGRWVRGLGPTFPWLAAALALVLGAGFVHLAWAPLHLATFFVGALVAHHRLAESRPDARRLTAFYLAIGLGGVLGSLFCAILAPLLFDRMVEYPLALFLACLAFAARPKGERGRGPAREAAIPAVVAGTGVLLTRLELGESALGAIALVLATGLGVLAVWKAGARPLRFALTIGAVLLAGGLAPDRGGEVVRRGRNFFGALRVLEDAEARTRRLMHGSTLHGQQSLDPDLREEPSTYFTRPGPIGGLLDARAAGLDRPDAEVAVVGLGTGTLACYARPGESWTFYEIDPAVARVAEDPSCFTFLADARRRGAEVSVVEGDARLRMAADARGGFALIVLDAFSSDAVPVHLLSREALALYRGRLAPGGLLAFNITNRYLDLEPLMARQAADAGLACRVRYDLSAPPEARAIGWQPSIWAVMAEPGAELPPGPWAAPRARPGSSPWTDDYSDLASYLILGRRKLASFAGGENEAIGRKALP